MYGGLLDEHYAADSVGQYLNAVLRHQTLLDMTVPSNIKKLQSDLCRASHRDSGDAHRMLPITYDMLKEMRVFVAGYFKDFLFRMALITWYFVMRIDESLGATGPAGLTRRAFVGLHLLRI